MAERTKCEVWSRCVGYIRPVNQFNNGVKERFDEMKTFDSVLGKKQK